MSNPWNLSDEQFATMQALTGKAKGVSKVAAQIMGVHHKTVDKRVEHVCRKMGVSNRLEAVLLFDRTYRSEFTAIRPAHGVMDCKHCAGLGFVQREVA